MLPLVLLRSEAARGGVDGALRWSRTHPLTLAGAGLVAAVAVPPYPALVDAPPGFFSDEASVAYDARGIATDLRDQHGDLLPVFFRAFGTWRGSLLIYVMAAVFRVAGAGVLQARVVTTSISLLTAALLA